jgi:putative ABC transport system permease protein
MKILKYLQVAVESIVAHKLRAILTMLGIIIGVAAVLTTMGIGRGAASSMTERIASQGTNLLTLSPGASFSGGLAGEGGSAGTLTMGDVTALSDRTLHPALQLVAPAYGSSTRLVYEGNNTQSTVNGVTPEYATVRNMTLASGRFLSDEDNEQQNRVVVLGVQLDGGFIWYGKSGWSLDSDQRRAIRGGGRVGRNGRLRSEPGYPSFCPA